MDCEGTPEDRAVAPFPLVVVDAEGGPYDTGSFVAGCSFAAIERTMQLLADAAPVTVVVPAGTEAEIAAAFPGWNAAYVPGQVASRVYLTPPERIDAECPPAVVRQVDLAAMHWGWQIIEDSGTARIDGWVKLTLQRCTRF